VWRSKLNTLAPQSLFWPLGIFFLDLEGALSLFLFWTNVDTFFEIGNGIVIIYNNSVVVGSGTLCDGLYMIDLMHSLSYFSSSVSFMNIVVVSKCSWNIETSSMLWHRHLDHISRPRIERLIKDGILVNIDFSNFDTCVDCVKGKISSKSRRQKDGRSENVIELIHTDICGPIIPAVLGNYRYFITFIDDYLCYGHFEVICEKSESLEAFKVLRLLLNFREIRMLKL
jgi:hypothetical protein